jgi:hypothetical protein
LETIAESTPPSTRFLVVRPALSLLLLAALALGCQRQPAAKAPSRAAFDRWRASSDDHDRRYRQLKRFLARSGVGSVVPTWQLVRQGTDWQRCGAAPFVVPPRKRWKEMVPTLRYLRDEVIPAVGPLEVVSSFRTDAFNRCAGGARGSRHRHHEAVDVVPTRSISRAALHARLGELWNKPAAKKARVRLGLYSGVRFHIDTHRHRRW